MQHTDDKPILRVLLIDDSKDDVVLIAIELGKAYSLIWQRIETEAELLMAIAEEWDVVICDYKLPRFNLERALEIVRLSKPDIPFIIISGVVDEDMVINILKKGANDFIQKDKMRRLSLAIDREIKTTSQMKAERKRANIRIQESYDQTILAWGKALELRDIYTEGHTERVTELTLRLAVALSVPHVDFVTLHRGSLLHDIGKMGIPDAVLLKRDELTEDEWKIMKMHPVLAKNMLQGIPFLEPAIVIPYSHHERWDGSGYPEGLRSVDIPYCARLFSVVDVYDALVTPRPYRSAWDKAEAIYYLDSEKGRLFDPQMVEAFIGMVGRG